MVVCSLGPWRLGLALSQRVRDALLLYRCDSPIAICYNGHWRVAADALKVVYEIGRTVSCFVASQSVRGVVAYGWSAHCAEGAPDFSQAPRGRARGQAVHVEHLLSHYCQSS